MYERYRDMLTAQCTLPTYVALYIIYIQLYKLIRVLGDVEIYKAADGANGDTEI